MLINVSSDWHGSLPEISPCGILMLCGDIVPATWIQRDDKGSMEWFKEKFIPHIEQSKCAHCVIIPGNHDFSLQRHFEQYKELFAEHNIYLLKDESVILEGYEIYGCPWVTGPAGWAFYTPNTREKYDMIPNTADVVLCHQPPRVNKVGCSYPDTGYDREFGSEELYDAILHKQDIGYLFCGHIHSGNHNHTKIGNVNVYNVSLKDESYEVRYPVLELNIEKGRH